MSVLSISFFQDMFWSFVILFMGQLKNWIVRVEKKGITRSKEPQGGIKPVVAAVRHKAPALRYSVVVALIIPKPNFSQ